MKYFLDTSAILSELPEYIKFENCVVPSEAIHELEDIKISKYKDDDIKFRARRAVNLIIDNNIEVYLSQKEDAFMELGLDSDSIILSSCKKYQEETKEDVTLITKDYLMYLFAINTSGLKAELLKDMPKEVYKGYKKYYIDDSNLINFLNHLDENQFECLTNEYIILITSAGEELSYKWNGNFYEEVKHKSLKSKMFGDIKPKDIYQKFAINSLINNDITVLIGKAGTGKSHLALSYVMTMLDSHKYSKLDVIHHFESLRNAKTLGYTKGDDMVKKLTSGLGGILSTKFGDITEVERMYHSGVLNITPTANIRGVELSDIIYVTEAQNIDTLTLKTIIQRCKEGSKIILEGDILEQKDINRESGLWRMIEVFRGDKSFSMVKLKNNYRNHIGDLADKM